MATGVRSQCGELLLHRGSIIKFWDKGLKENIPGIQTDKIKKQVLLKVVQGYDVVARQALLGSGDLRGCLKKYFFVLQVRSAQ